MKSALSNDFAHLGIRNVFNKTLRHLMNVSSLIDTVGKGTNLADILETMEEDGTIIRQQIPPIVSVLLGSKYNYACRSFNLDETYSDFHPIRNALSKWTGVDMVVIYYHPNLGPMPVNPKSEDHWATVHELKKDELIVVYAKLLNDDAQGAELAIDGFFSLLRHRIPKEVPAFHDLPKVAPVAAPSPAAAPVRPAAPTSAAPSAAAAAPAPQKAGQKNLTPKYSVQVTNELFHNGNVEAWKNIIESYEAKHSDCKVIVYHEGELIQDLNSLFKWGKVKHGGLIFFQVAGHNIKNVSRLQKYLFEGASKRFEAFLKHDVNKVLNLF